MSLLFTILVELCKDGWTGFNGYCYKEMGMINMFFAASDSCVSEDAHLIYIHSAEENQFVAGKLRRT